MHLSFYVGLRTARQRDPDDERGLLPLDEALKKILGKELEFDILRYNKTTE